MQKNLFGTDGIRGKVGQPPFTYHHMHLLASSVAQWLLSKSDKPTVLLAHDTRISCSWIKAKFKTVFLHHGIMVHDARTAPTPTVCAYLKNNHYTCGIIITASHNPYHDNGLKILYTNGRLTVEDELHISRLFYEQTLQLPNHVTGVEKQLNLLDWYNSQVSSYFQQNFLVGLTVVLDCAHGATYMIAQKIFRNLGAKVFTIHAHPNGKNINHNAGALHPQALQKAVKKYNAHIGFAFDGDGDRLVAVSRNGTVKNGDDIIALLSNHPLYKNEEHHVGTVMSNQGLAEFLQNNTKNFIRVAVGDKHIYHELKQKNALLGGEPSGHIMMKDYLHSGDGMYTALRTVEAILIDNNFEMNTFEHFPQALKNIPVSHKKELTNEPFNTIINTYKQLLPEGRTLIRYSGTEPYLRIMVEDKDIKHAQAICSALAKKLEKELH